MYALDKPYKKNISQLIQKTWDTPYLDIEKGVYAVFKKKFSFTEVDHTDGIGTKGSYHWKKRTFKNAVLDALAMNLNDLLLVRAQAFKLQNHITLPKDDHGAILEIVQVMSDECRKRSIAITGGETSIHNNTDGLDISMTVSGFVRKPQENRFEIGDVLVGVKSSGLHSNGFTKVREVFGEGFRKEFIEPTTIYSNMILPLFGNFNIHGMMHITGGAYTKLEGVLDGSDVHIHKEHSLQPHQIFHDIYGKDVSDEEMYKTFNCGVGLILSLDNKDASRILKQIPGSDIIGNVVLGNGRVSIDSMFSNKQVTL